MVRDTAALALFPFIEAEHPLYAPVQRLSEALQAHPRYAELAWRAGRRAGFTRHSELKCAPGPRGWALERFYCSLQWREPRQPQPFQALTLSSSAKGEQIAWQAFPSDPRLPTLASYFAPVAQPAGLQIDVLRYVPLRRLTFRVSAASGAVIGKFKRQSRLHETFGRLATITRAVQQAGASFLVAAPLAIDETRGLFFQQALPGQNLADLIDTKSLAGLLRQVGALHHELHELPANDLPGTLPDGALGGLQREIGWIACLRPGYARALAEIHGALLRHMPSPAAGDFCHGDFVCSQVLAGERWGVTDFDLAHRGDRYRELGMLLASLPHDLPLLSAERPLAPAARAALLAQAEHAYLAGYREQLGHELDWPRLRWQRARAEVFYLALALKKDWPAARDCDATIERIAGLVARLGRAGGCDEL